MNCPRCDGELYEVFFGDGIKRWRCFGRCGRIFNSIQWQESSNGDEIIRRMIYVDKKAICKINEGNSNVLQ